MFYLRQQIIFMSKEKDLIHEIYCLFFPAFKLSGIGIITCWLTNADFLLSVCNCAHVIHTFICVYNITVMSLDFTAVLCRSTACYLPYNENSKKKKKASNILAFKAMFAFLFYLFSLL